MPSERRGTHWPGVNATSNEHLTQENKYNATMENPEVKYEHLLIWSGRRSLVAKCSYETAVS